MWKRPQGARKSKGVGRKKECKGEEEKSKEKKYMGTERTGLRRRHKDEESKGPVGQGSQGKRMKNFLV